MLLTISTVIAFLVTAGKGCPVGPSPPSENLSLSSLANFNLYRYYDLENKDYNMEFFLNAFKKLDDYPNCTLAKHIALVETIPFLMEDYPGRETRTVRSLVEEALEKSKNTAIEDIVKFRVAYTLQLNAIFYLNALFNKDNLEWNIKLIKEEDEVEVTEEMKKEASRDLGAVVRILRKAVTTGDVPEADVRHSLGLLVIAYPHSPEKLHMLFTEGFNVISLWDQKLLEHKNAIDKIACEPDADADEQHSVADRQAGGSSGGEPSPDANPGEFMNSTLPEYYVHNQNLTY
ncbi:unnamed protein product [Cylicocyclus nassatus]|uniref:Uncharacterized protein n=1 Tax=Cylicocyclus nassatus TaxID=53992 RepID=A0AA36MHT3_CYLNA|nr:unnamed protein product [Cylicocyclus nassatus]